MTEPIPILVVFGLDPDSNPRAGRFAEPDAEVAVKAAALLGYRVARISNIEFLEALPDGDIFARGIGFIRRVKRAKYEELVAVTAEDAGERATAASEEADCDEQ
jgi:hypothetical protein